MFDIGFWELALVGVVALLVIGPERLPKVAHTAGLWFGKARRMLSAIKADIEQEVRAEELKRIVQEQARSSGVYEMLEETRSTVTDAREELEQVGREAQAEPEIHPASAQVIDSAVSAPSATDGKAPHEQ